MNTENFKMGDNIFFPTLTSSILTLSKESLKGLHVEHQGHEYIFDRKGCLVDSPLNKQQSIFHATYTEYERLSKFYPKSNFTKPPKTKTELVNLMLESNVNYFILNWYGFGFIELHVYDSKDIKRIIGNKQVGVMHIDNCDILDQYTGKKIIDWNEGKPVLGKD